MRFLAGLFVTLAMQAATGTLAANAATPSALDAPNGVCPDPPKDLTPLADTHTMPPFPAMSAFMNEEGKTTLLVLIGTDGSVTDDTVQNSSGSSRLDAAALSYVKTHWRWVPITENCKPATARTRVSIVWNLAKHSSFMPPMIGKTMDVADYPAGAAERKEQGISGVAIVYYPTGAPKASWIVKSSGFPDLDAAAEHIALSRWPITPMMFEGKPAGTAAFFAMEWVLPPTTP